jgi:Protein of unknown function (DUF3592)
MFQLLPIFYILAALWFTYNQATALRQAQASESWPRLPGVVTFAQRQFLSFDAYGNLTGIQVMVEYQVHNETFSTNTLSFGPHFGRTQQILQQYRPGNKVDVYYDPDEPETAVLQPGVKNVNYFMLLVGLFFTALTIIYYFIQY